MDLLVSEQYIDYIMHGATIKRMIQNVPACVPVFKLTFPRKGIKI